MPDTRTGWEATIWNLSCCFKFWELNHPGSYNSLRLQALIHSYIVLLFIDKMSAFNDRFILICMKARSKLYGSSWKNMEPNLKKTIFLVSILRGECGIISFSSWILKALRYYFLIFYSDHERFVTLCVELLTSHLILTNSGLSSNISSRNEFGITIRQLLIK